MSNINFTYTNLTPFKWYVLENFPFIEADFDALTNWQLFCKLGKEINKIINSVNVSGEQVENLTTAFNNLQNYVNNYFNNLDVQDEINNKLDEMVGNGELETLIQQTILNPVTPIIDTQIYGQANPKEIDMTNKSYQSFVMANNKMLICCSGDTSENGVLLLYDLSTGLLVNYKNNLSIGHCNDVTYCDKDNYYYIACAGGNNGLNKISVFDENLDFVKDIDFTNMNLKNPCGIAYNKEKDVFYCLLSNNTINILNYELNNIILTNSLVQQNQTHTQQSIFFDGKYIYNIININNKYTNSWNFNKLDLYDVNLNYYTSQKITILGEIESCCYYNEDLYLMRYTQSQGVIYKGNQIQNQKVYDYINPNYLMGTHFSNYGAPGETIYINSNYNNLFVDGSESKPFSNLYVAMDSIKNLSNSLTVYLTGDFSKNNINIKGSNRTINFKGTDEVNRAKIGGIYLENCSRIILTNIEIVKKNDVENCLLSCYSCNYIYLNNINFNGVGTENNCIRCISSRINGSKLYFNSNCVHPEQMVYLSENSFGIFSGEIQVNNNGNFQFSNSTKKLWYQPPISVLNSDGTQECNILGGNISFKLADIKTPGNYRVEAGNTIQDAPEGLTNNAIRVIIENNNNNMIYKLIPLNQNKLYIGVKNEKLDTIVWKNII